MIQRRYRIVARFEQIVVAENIAEARQIAEDLQAGTQNQQQLMQNAQYAWSTIEPLDAD